MNLAKAKDYAKWDILTGFQAATTTDGGWFLIIETKQKNEGYTMQTATGQDKVYTSLDSLHREVARILGHQPESWVYRL